MYFLVGTIIALLVIVIAIAIAGPGNGAARSVTPRSRRVQPHTRDVHDLVDREASLARDKVHQHWVCIGY
jgi:hypothetical protein